MPAADLTPEDAALLEAFERQAIPKPEWTHRTHVKVAYLYACCYPFDEAIVKLREGIKALNAVLEVPEGPLHGYNETTTHALLHLIAAVAGAYRYTHAVDGADAFCDMHPQLMSKHVLRFFYSPEQRMHPDAKTTFVEPDLAPLPEIRG